MTVQLIALFWLFAIIGYLSCRVAFSQGRKSKWEEMSREYICIHKSCLITHNNTKKWLDKDKKKRYNKSAYKRK